MKGRTKMVRKFLECSDNNSRLKFFNETILYDWTESELESVASIMGIAKEGAEAKRLYDMIKEELLKRESFAA